MANQHSKTHYRFRFLITDIIQSIVSDCRCGFNRRTTYLLTILLRFTTLASFPTTTIFSQIFSTDFACLHTNTPSTMNQILPPRPGSRWEKICSKFDQRRARRREEEQPQCIERDRSPQNYMTQVDNRPGFGPLPENDNPFAHYEQYPLFLDTDYFAPRWDLDEDRK